MIFTTESIKDKDFLVTKEFQNLIDETSKQKGKLIVSKGKYLVSSLFLKSNMELYFEEGAVLEATTQESNYPLIDTRVAGIEMKWYPALLNILNEENIIVSGKGIIYGNGPYWWDKYWGKDRNGGMRKTYDPKGLRWVVDYDCIRLRNILISKSKNIELKDFTSKDSGFWNIHILYSNNIHVHNLTVDSGDINSPSTDGIDIDSSHNVLVENCTIDCHDDSICLKSGRDYDGLRVNIPTYNVEVKNCTILRGAGITLGSEVSGGIYNINIHDIIFNNTDSGFRIKSSIYRKGYVKDITVSNLKMTNVKYIFNFRTSWHPLYDTCNIPEEYKNKELPKHWYTLLKEVPNIKNTEIKNVSIKNVDASYTNDCNKPIRAFYIEGFDDSPFTNFSFKDINIICKEYGLINNILNFQYDNLNITVADKFNEENNKDDQQ